MNAVYVTPEAYRASGLTLSRYLAAAIRAGEQRGVPVRADNPWMRAVLHEQQRRHRV